MERLVLTIGMLLTCFTLVSCGKGSSSSSSSTSSPPSGFTSEQRDQYNKLTPEGKEYVKQQMDAYDRATKR
jgi:hypothetical protein